jgi:glutamine phosphoribosylpyrophosphate amidotransferase
MCALFGSPNKELFLELSKLNSYRGNHSYSVSTYDFESVDVYVKALGEFEMPDIEAPYYIGHTQAPTTEAKSTSSIHPSVVEHSYLWHNGIIKERQVKKWQGLLNTLEPWDTKLLHHQLYCGNVTDVLSKADGSFACVWFINDTLYLFRNANCPLFTDGMSYSSTKFNGSYPIDCDIIYKLTDQGVTKTDIRFETAQNFYWSLD